MSLLIAVPAIPGLHFLSTVESLSSNRGSVIIDWAVVLSLNGFLLLINGKKILVSGMLTAHNLREEKTGG